MESDKRFAAYVSIRLFVRDLILICSGIVILAAWRVMLGTCAVCIVCLASDLEIKDYTMSAAAGGLSR